MAARWTPSAPCRWEKGSSTTAAFSRRSRRAATTAMSLTRCARTCAAAAVRQTWITAPGSSWITWQGCERSQGHGGAPQPNERNRRALVLPSRGRPAHGWSADQQPADLDLPGDVRAACGHDSAERRDRRAQQGGSPLCAHGGSRHHGWMEQARATDDVDILVQKRYHKKAVRAVTDAYPELEVTDHPVVTRFVDAGTGK